MLNVFETELSSLKEMNVCMALGEKIHTYMKQDLYGVPVALSIEDFEKKNYEAMLVFDP